MKKKIIKYILLSVGFFILIIIYLSVVGLETDKFNTQIRNKFIQTNNKLDLKLKKVKLTLDLLNFKINAKTIDTKIIYKKKTIELEYIKTQISLLSLIKNKFASSNLKISSKSILLKDLVTLVRTKNNRPELFLLENLIKKGDVIIDITLNIDENGKIKNDYEINGFLNEGKINLFNNYNFEKINFFLNIKDNIFNFQNINFTTNNINFFSDNFKIIQNKEDFLFEGIIENKKSILNDELLNIIKLKFKSIDFKNLDFASKNNFSFKIDNRFKLKNLAIESEIKIDEFKYKKPNLFKNYFPEIKDMIDLKNHNIKIRYKKNDFYLKGIGKIQLEEKQDEIEYLITNKDEDFKIISDISLSELNINNQEILKDFFPETNEVIILKDHQVKINYNKNNLSFNGIGKIQLQNESDIIDYSISKIGNKFNFDTKLVLNKTLFNIDYLNYKNNKKSKTELSLIGNYKKNIGLKLNHASVLSHNNRILLKNFLLDKENKIIKVDKIDLDYFDTENKKNKLFFQRKQKNNYELIGSKFNANKIITNLFEKTDDKQFKILKNDIKLTLNLNEVYIDNENIIKDLTGNLQFKNNKVFDANIFAVFNNNKNLKFTINNNNNEKITTLYSSKAKPFVKRYKFIKGFEDGDLDFYSSKKNNISNSILKIDNFKVQEIPILAKLLTLASLQGIADLLTGEGIRFTDFEMIFSNNKSLMKIEEMYAIGPSISILMDGYIQKNELISLRGTLVPASTINRTIASIPLVGDFLIGKKVGEGVFGVSFKIKGPPNDLKTTVNPVKTLTPRFITRTLEKIKKN
tara:strand:+ start:275 stop:2689 length:2415 start_codon:yes stop_codon:yes gene_type:complete